MNIKQLKLEIDNQRNKNIELYDKFQYRLHEKEMQPLVEAWRAGSIRLKSLLSELRELEMAERVTNKKKETPASNTFVNGYGEATHRDITSSTYRISQKRLSKQIMNFVS